MGYKERLINFNNSEKYKHEMEFMTSLLSVKKEEKILDFGCGIGTMVENLQEKTEGLIFGHDQRNYDISNDWFLEHIYFPFDKVFFMHSIAHVHNIEFVIDNFNSEYLNSKGRIVIITPNKLWLNIKNKGVKLKSDSSVINHFSLSELHELFKDFNIICSGQFGEELHGQNERLFLIAEKK